MDQGLPSPSNAEYVILFNLREKKIILPALILVLSFAGVIGGGGVFQFFVIYAFS